MIFANQILMDGLFTVANQGNASLAETVMGLDEQLDSTNPATVAGIQQAATDFLKNADQFAFLSLAPSFEVDADSMAGGEGVITDWDGLDTDIDLDSAVSVGAWSWDGETGTFTNSSVLGSHVTDMSFELDGEKAMGAGQKWQFSVKIDGGTPTLSRTTKNFDVLNDRLDDRITFPLLLIPTATSTVQFLLQPLSGGASTMTIFKFTPRFLPVRPD